MLFGFSPGDLITLFKHLDTFIELLYYGAVEGFERYLATYRRFTQAGRLFEQAVSTSPHLRV